MYIDKQAILSDDQAVTVTAVSENIYDTGVEKDVGPGKRLNLLCQVSEEDFAGGTSLQVALQTDTVANFASPKVLATSRAVPVAELVAGFDAFGIDVIPAGSQRYLRLAYTVVGTMTAGKITAGIVLEKQENNFGE